MSTVQPSAIEPSALRVADGQTNTTNPMPGHLYFFRAPGYSTAIPVHQERARQELENANFVIRVALQKNDPDRFKEFYFRLLMMAQASFDPAGFNEAAINDIGNFKNEVVQVAGSAVKSRYTRTLVYWVIGAIALVLVLCWFFDEKVEAANTTAIDFSLLNTGLLLSASFVGLLFASMTRSVEPTFEKLLIPDADLMAPWFRLLFYGIAIFGLALLFETKMVTIAFGEKVSTAEISHNWLVAICIGLFLGIAERALPQEVMQWSKKFLPSSQQSSA